MPCRAAPFTCGCDFKPREGRLCATAASHAVGWHGMLLRCVGSVVGSMVEIPRAMGGCGNHIMGSCRAAHDGKRHEKSSVSLGETLQTSVRN